MLIRQTLAYLPSQLFGPLLQFAAVITLTHFLTPADYGLTMLVFTTQELIFLICLFWWTSYLQRYGGQFESEADKQRFRATENAVLIASSALQVLATLAVISLTSGFHSPQFLVVGSLFVITRSFVGYLSERARFEVRILDFTILQIVPPLLGLVFSVIGLELFGPRPGLVLAAFALVQIVVSLIIGFRMRVFTVRLRVDRAILVAAMGIGVAMIYAGALQWVAANGIRFVVQIMNGAEQLGLLSVSWGIAQRLAAMAGMLVTAAAYPLAVRAMHAGDSDGARAQISANSVLLLLVMAPAVAGVIAIDAPMMRLLVADEFEAVSIAILPAAIIAAGVRNMRVHGWDQLYLLFEAQRAMILLATIEVVGLITGSIIGLYYGGIYGAVLANAIVTVLAAVADYLYLRARFGLNAPFGQYARILLAAVLMLVGLRLTASHGWGIHPTWGSVGLAVLEGALIYSMAIALFFPKERAIVIDKIRRVLARRGSPPEAPAP
ncbi:MAG: oligosaccharide flippase family protein [Proteobacteria bacterium]|nr:oligosaccharide flippase family protein [Pseudomonadota bacterium]